MQYIRSIDGLRAIAVLAVVFHHSEIPYFKGGFLGVDVFFVISGFLIGRIITSELDQGTFSVGTFLLKRARRLLPSLLLLLLAVELLSYLLLLPHECLTISRSVPFVLSFTSNYYFASNLNYWDGAANENFTIHTWSLGVEEQFYIVFPVLMLSMYAVCKKAKGSVVALLLVASMGLAEVASKTNASILAFYSLPTRFWELARRCRMASGFTVDSMASSRESVDRRWPRAHICARLRCRQVSSFGGNRVRFSGQATVRLNLATVVG